MGNGFIYVKVLDSEIRWQPAGYFNPNAYPSNYQSLVESCWTRFSLIFSYFDNMQKIRVRDTQAFVFWLDKNVPAMKNRRKDSALEISYETIDYISSFYMFLVMIKSFLDIWAKLSSVLIDPKSKIGGFNKDKVCGEELAGGKFLNWLRGSVPQTMDIIGLTALINRNTKLWITNAVKYRDKILHYGEIRDIKPLRFILKDDSKTEFTEADLLQASMPNGRSVLDYSKYTILRLNDFVIKFIRLLPNIDKKLLSLKPLIKGS